MTAAERREVLEGPRRLEIGSDRTTGPEERETLERAQRGDVDAFETLYRRHVGRIRALALRATADPERAATIVQDVFVRCWERLHTFAWRSTFATWLYRLAVNRIADALRSEMRAAERWAPADAAEAVPSPAAIDADARLDLEAAIRALPAGARWVFVLHDVEGHDHAEIAALTGIAVGTSKSQLCRARRLLREMLTR